MERRGGFSPEAKQYARDRANGHCEHGRGYCPRPNTNNVGHLMGCFEGKLKGVPEGVISDPKQNAIMECRPHEIIHDITEKAEVIGVLLWRRKHRKEKF